jgi:hypothetical protein
MPVSPFTPTLFPPPSRGRVSLIFPYFREGFFIKLLTISIFEIRIISNSNDKIWLYFHNSILSPFSRPGEPGHDPILPLAPEGYPRS